MRLIDADKAYEVLTEYYHHRRQGQHDALQDAISRVPTINPPQGYRPLPDGKGWEYFGKPEIRIGRWLETPDGDWHCSECGAIVEKDEQIRHYWQRCYHCGAKMERDDD